MRCYDFQEMALSSFALQKPTSGRLLRPHLVVLLTQIWVFSRKISPSPSFLIQKILKDAAGDRCEYRLSQPDRAADLVLVYCSFGDALSLMMLFFVTELFYVNTFALHRLFHR